MQLKAKPPELSQPDAVSDEGRLLLGEMQKVTGDWRRADVVALEDHDQRLLTQYWYDWQQEYLLRLEAETARNPDANLVQKARELASALGGEVAATRAIVDAGWIPYATQIGQTGKTVAPKLYLGAGVSGAIQHKVGMQNSENILAINKDPNAPIFEYSDLGVVGDLHKILPKLTEAIKAKKA